MKHAGREGETSDVINKLLFSEHLNARELEDQAVVSHNIMKISQWFASWVIKGVTIY